MNLNKPKPFNPSKNQIAKDWEIWREEFLVYLKLSNGYTQFSEEQRALLLINLMGTEAIKAMEQITFENPNDKKDMSMLLAKFDEFFNPCLNEVEERYKFFSRRKSPNEDLDKYILNMKDRALKCNFGSQSEKFIIDMLILSMDKYSRELIWASDLKTLAEIVHNCKQFNINQSKMKELSENLENAKPFKNEQPEKYFSAKCVCSKCGMNHPYKQCPAYDAICQKCLLKGHYTSKCKQIDQPFNKETNISKDEKNQAREMSINEQSKPSTSKVKESQEHRPKFNMLENCLWCNSYHIPGKCPHSYTRTKCNNFPHNIGFNCKKNPHQDNCCYKNLMTPPSTSNTDKAKMCFSCGSYSHLDNECLRKNNLSNNHAQNTMNDLVEGFVEIGNSFHTQTQPQKQAPMNQPRQTNPNQRRQNTRPSKNTKNEKSDACCIS